jgi:phosphoserine phosphatase RsbU/P
MPQHSTSAETVRQIAAMLAEQPLLASLNEEARLRIAKSCELIRFRAGAILMRQGERGSFALMLLEGVVDIYVEIPTGPIQIAMLGRNQIVGELGLFTDTPRTATAISRSDTLAVRIAHEMLLELVAAHPSIALKIIGELGRRLQAMNLPLAYLSHAAIALGRDEYDPTMLGELTNEPGMFAGFAGTFAQMAEELRSKQQRHQEMLAAAVIQQSILPAPLGRSSVRAAIDLHAETHPAREIGGDFYDYFLLDDSHLALTIADVAGKGIPAALYMAVARTVMRSLASIPDVAARIREANRLLSTENAASMFVTMFHGVLDLNTGALVYCNAGHNPPYLLRAETVEILDPTGPAFGLDLDIAHRIEEIVLRPGDTLFLFTDGLTEALDAKGEEFGVDRLETALTGARELTASQLVGKVLAEVTAFAEGTEQFDDITCLALRTPSHARQRENHPARVAE